MLIDDKLLQSIKNEISTNLKEGIIEQLVLMKDKIVKIMKDNVVIQVKTQMKFSEEKENGFNLAISCMDVCMKNYIEELKKAWFKGEENGNS